MAFTFIGKSTYTSSASASIVINKPTGTSDGDIMFCLVSTRSGQVNSIPSGRTSLGTYVSGFYYWNLLWKLASSEGTSYTFGLTSSSYTEDVIVTYRGGFDTTNPIDIVSNTSYMEDNTILRAADMSVTNINSPLIFIGSRYATSTSTFTNPSVPTTDWVEDYDGGSTTGRFWDCIDSMVWTGNGNTGNIDATMTSVAGLNAFKHAFAVALNPAASSFIKTINGLAKASVKTINGLAIASVKTFNGLA